MDAEAIELAFRDYDDLLRAERPTAPTNTADGCVACGEHTLCHATSGTPWPGSLVCETCGAVQARTVLYEYMYGRHVPTRFSNYKRIHHWHERVSQLLLLESEIPVEKLQIICKSICASKIDVLSKCNIRQVLRSLGMQQYIEKWLQIIQRLTGIAPPVPGPTLLMRLDECFLDLQRPFNTYKHDTRKNFLNYNFVFTRLLQHLNCKQLCMFFPLIKSRQKLNSLDVLYKEMASNIGWATPPLVHVTPFAVTWPPEDLSQMQKLLATDIRLIPVVPRAVPQKTGSQTWGRRRVLTTKIPQLQPHSKPPPKQFHKLALRLKRRYNL